MLLGSALLVGPVSRCIERARHHQLRVRGRRRSRGAGIGCSCSCASSVSCERSKAARRSSGSRRREAEQAQQPLEEQNAQLRRGRQAEGRVRLERLARAANAAHLDQRATSRSLMEDEEDEERRTYLESSTATPSGCSGSSATSCSRPACRAAGSSFDQSDVDLAGHRAGDRRSVRPGSGGRGASISVCTKRVIRRSRARPTGSPSCSTTCSRTRSSSRRSRWAGRYLARRRNGKALIEVSDTGSGSRRPSASISSSASSGRRSCSTDRSPAPGSAFTSRRRSSTAHGGQIAVHSVEDEGTTFMVELPVARANCERVRPLILCADDDEDILVARRAAARARRVRRRAGGRRGGARSQPPASFSPTWPCST